MKHSFLYIIFTLCSLSAWAADVNVEFSRSLLGRDYVIAARVQDVSSPVELGKMKVYPGLRVYNPQIVRFFLDGDSLTMIADDAKRGPQRITMPVIEKNGDMVRVEMDRIFTNIMRGVDILSGKQQPGKLNPQKTKITMKKGDAGHLEVSIRYTYENAPASPFVITIRKSLLLLPEKPMQARPDDKRLGYKCTNNRDIDRFDLSHNAEIVFYVSDEFPPLWQSAIKQGIEDWNIAFGKIGRPAVMKAVRYSEAGRDFDPFDITNNCFFKVESDFANAQGCHWTDPRSGEIIQADVQFYSGVADKLKSWMLMHTGAYNKTIADGNIPDDIMQRMLRYAAAHEVGHCLGLEHNYRASFAYGTEDLRKPDFCAANGTTPSIMDYARFNYVAQPGDNVTEVYPPILGDYDIYAIEAGYRTFSDAEYKAFIDEHQSNPRCLYSKLSVSTLPKNEAVQPKDLGNDQLASSRYGIKNITALPVPVLRQLKADDVHAFYFQLLTHVIPCLERAEVKKFLESELNSGYKILNSKKMQSVYGNQSDKIESMRVDFINKVRKEYSLDIVTNPVSVGMWMPHQMVSDDVFSLLKKDGIRLSKKDIYNINKRCAAGAALSLSVDNGIASPYASASFVSKDGLVMTNFHCVSNYVQRLAKGDNDYMRYGCWASKREEEAPLFNLQVHQVLSVEDVTDKVFAGTEGLGIDERDALADKQAQALMDNSKSEYGTTLRAYSLMGGQQYVLVKYRTFSDVRIVACPPMWLGAYGGDDDNWRWPRYSCDFAFLRVYVSPEGESSDYSKRNVPYHPVSYLRIAKEQVKEGDLAMVMGYPSQTRKNIPAYALDKIVNRDTQLRANSLKAKIDFLRKCRDKSEGTAKSGYDVRIGKLMNVYLRSKGEIDGVRATNLVDVKRKEDLELQQWINEDEGRRQRYGSNLISQMDSVYSLLTVYNHMDEAFSQFVGSGAGIIPFAGKFEKLIAMDRSKRKSKKEDMQREIPEIQRNIREFFPSISMEEDCGMMKTLLPIYLKAVDKKYLPAPLQGDVDMDHLYATSLLTDSARLERFLMDCTEKGTAELSNDSLYRICLDIYVNRVQKQNREATPLKRLNTKLYNIYRRAWAEKEEGKLMPYDANHTLRFSTGRVFSIDSVADMKLRTDSVSEKMHRLLETSPSLPIACFTTNAETAAGNSGSAVLNAKGELIGLNFDRTAESTFSIYRTDPLSTRNIVVSTDYILWVIKNLSYSQYILNEL